LGRRPDPFFRAAFRTCVHNALALYGQRFYFVPRRLQGVDPAVLKHEIGINRLGKGCKREKQERQEARTHAGRFETQKYKPSDGFGEKKTTAP
jgi:hypothetical protein